MTTVAPSPTSLATPRDAASRSVAPRAVFALAVALALAGGLLWTGGAATARAAAEAGADLTRLLRGMALIKSLMAAGALAAVWWRLGSDVSRLRLAAYVAIGAATAAGPGLIWGMEWVRTGAMLLHAGLLASVVTLWRDPTVAARFAAMLDARRLRAPR